MWTIIGVLARALSGDHESKNMAAKLAKVSWLLHSKGVRGGGMRRRYNETVGRGKNGATDYFDGLWSDI